MTQKIRDYLLQHRLWDYLLRAVLVLVTLFGSYFLLQYSTSDCSMPEVINSLMNLKFTILNLLTLGCLVALLMLLTNRLWLSCLLCSLSCGIITIINYYLIAFHGMPLSFLLLNNLATAMNVVSAYSITIDRPIFFMIMGTLILAAGTVVYHTLLDADRFRKLSPPPKTSPSSYHWYRSGVLCWLLQPQSH